MDQVYILKNWNHDLESQIFLFEKICVSNCNLKSHVQMLSWNYDFMSYWFKIVGLKNI